VRTLRSSTPRLSLVIGGLVLVLAGGVAAFAYFRIGVALSRMVSAVRILAGGDLAVEVPSLATQNEIGDLARAVVTFRESIVERVKLEASAEEERLKKDERERELGEVLRSFETDIVQVVNEVNGETQLMNDTASSLSGIADTTRREAERATSASADASAGIQAIAGTTEELGASISSIAEQAKRASDSVAAAAAVAERADGQVGGLTDAASQIGEVVELISSIARQTNLLALNATIEAARAGEAGRGFAVVASEVKTLAGQTAKATEEISRQVTGIQAASTEAADSIKAIATMMREVTTLANSIASAVTQQDAAAREMSGNITRAADGSSIAAKGVESVSGAVGETTRAAVSVQDVSAKLAAVSERLSATVTEFIRKVGTEEARAAA
jgi:methyl-accepting chemotaxis protein